MTDTTQNTTQNNSDWQKREIGALWRREGKNQNYLSGKITLGDSGKEKTFQVVIFTNKYKKQDNHPDFRIYEDTPRAEKPQPTAANDDILNTPAPAQEDTDVPAVLQ